MVEPVFVRDFVSKENTKRKRVRKCGNVAYVVNTNVYFCLLRTAKTLRQWLSSKI